MAAALAELGACDETAMARTWLFDLGAPAYDWLTSQEVWREHVRSLAKRFAPGTRAVLDLGTGNAVSAVALAQALPEARIVGLDRSAAMLVRARSKVNAGGLAERVPLVRADACALPFRDGAFAAATGHSFLYLVADKSGALAEARRVLRPGGRLILMEPQAGFWLPPARLVARSSRFAVSVALWRLVSRVKGRFTPDALRGALVAAGFGVVAVEPTLGGLGLIAVATA